MEFIMGGVIIFGGNFAPKDWAFCNGQLIPISQNQALYAILGTTWGGDGRTNFELPDLRSRVPVGMGQGRGLSQVFEGAQMGTENMTLSIPQMPLHSHDATFQGTGGSSGKPIDATVVVNAYSGQGNSNDPTDRYWAGNTKAGVTTINGYTDNNPDTTMATGAVKVAVSGGGGGITGGNVFVSQTGGENNFSLMQPSLGVAFIIAQNGIFPARN